MHKKTSSCGKLLHDVGEQSDWFLLQFVTRSALISLWTTHELISSKWLRFPTCTWVRETDEHSESLFKELEMLKLSDLVTLNNARLMYYKDLLPSFFDSFLQTVSSAQSLTSFALNELISAPSKQTMVNLTFGFIPAVKV